MKRRRERKRDRQTDRQTGRQSERVEEASLNLKPLNNVKRDHVTTGSWTNVHLFVMSVQRCLKSNKSYPIQLEDLPKACL